MKKLQALILFLSCLLLGYSASLRAEDIDIYVDGPTNTGVPNVLFVMDTGANFSSSASVPCTAYASGGAPSLGDTAGGVEQCALVDAISALPDDGTVNIGMLVNNNNSFATDTRAAGDLAYHETCGGTYGGCLVRPLTVMNAANKTSLINFIKSWKASGQNSATEFNVKSGGDRTANTMQEAWAYYNGKVGMSGKDYSTSLLDRGCQKNFVIFIGNAFTNSGTPGDGGNQSPFDGTNALTSTQVGATDPQKLKISETVIFQSPTCGVDSAAPDTSASNWSENWADEWARLMYKQDGASSLDAHQNIITYTIGVVNDSQCKPDYPALLSTMAKHGGGKYYKTSNSSEVAAALTEILNEVQAVNSVFASATLPVSVNAQGTYKNQVFLGMFRPDGSGKPRWIGNLKQYKFILDSKNVLKLGDQNGNAAITENSNGFLSPNAKSFWTYINDKVKPDSTGGFFVNDDHGAGKAYDSPDGEMVDKGGVAQQIRKKILSTDYAATPSGPRKVYTYCPGGASCNSALSHNSDAHTSNEFSVSNNAITTELLNAVAPVDVTSLTRSGTQATATTSSAHGLAAGDLIMVTGAFQDGYNGIKTVGINGLTSTQFTFTVPEYPVTPALGSYTASLSSTTSRTVSSITRSGTTATVSLTSHGYVTGNMITISGAAQTGYNGTFPITSVDNNTFTYQVTETPVSPAGGGTAMVGSNIATIAGYNANPNPGVQRTGITVTVTTTGNHGYATGNMVTLSGIRDSSGSLIAEYNIGPVRLTRTANKEFTFSLTATSPASPASFANVSGIQADRTASAVITSLTRFGNIVTATAAAGHSFSVGDLINIGGTQGSNEGGYIGSFTVLPSGHSATTFRFQVPLTPVTPATTLSSIRVSKTATSDRTSLINWVRGEDNYHDEASPGSYTVRPSVHGDVLHSRPVVVNYGDDDERGTVVFYGANDGMFRAINGSQDTNIGTGDNAVPPGGELWSLVLPEHFGKLNRQRINTPELKFSNTTLANAQPKNYFVDGPIGIYQKLKVTKDATTNKDVTTTDKAYLYLTMRRGGRFMYALDVSKPTDPKVLWKISNSDTGFSELGQTWSRPRLTLVHVKANADTDTVASTIPVLVFGAGYDPKEDNEPPTTNTMGRGIFVVNAETGDLIWSANPVCKTSATCRNVEEMKYAIPSDISFVDRNNDGKIDKAYFGDLGGNVWRVNMHDTDTGQWTVTKLAALGCGNTGVCTSEETRRKFFFPPTVLSVGATGVDNGSYDMVLIGSGDREHPLMSSSSYDVTNRFYMLKDTNTVVGSTGTSGINEDKLVDVSPSSSSSSSSDPYNKTLSGYYITLAEGEKSVNAPTTVYGTTYFGTNMPVAPSKGSCSSNLGEARGYALNPFTGAFTSHVYEGGGLPPSPVSGLVDISEKGDTEKVLKPFCIGCGGRPDCNSALENCSDSIEVAKKPRRSYWYKK